MSKIVYHDCEQQFPEDVKSYGDLGAPWYEPKTGHWWLGVTERASAILHCPWCGVKLEKPKEKTPSQ
jgi:hypothetical protein